jgi:hypothetical protein
VAPKITSASTSFVAMSFLLTNRYDHIGPGPG